MSETPDLGKDPRPDQQPGQQPGQQPWTDAAAGQPGPAHGQQPSPPGPYGANPYAPGPYAGFAPPDHPRTMTVLVLGILGIVLCQATAPFAWVMGKRALAEIDASGGAIGGRSQVQIGYILGIVGTVILGVVVAFFLVYLVIILAVVAGAAGSS
ncbi:DUF4190 domain-containing protein [Nocardioides litoris]|uniref:DUF4190 domain-containing protein n=1 Tax=Nocardioides litoris TaxID=1926648 RepID=UPI001B86E79A|nr:DUF4190 domain-containing protein [Nocardioides litoris]